MNWEWVAGFFEGEGHIYWQEGKQGTKKGTGGRITIGQKDKRPLVAIQAFLLEQGLKNPRLYLRRGNPDVKHRPDIWILTTTLRSDVILFLENTIDSLYQKREKGLFVLETLKQMNADRRAILGEALQLRQQGLTFREIARETGIGRIALSNYIRAEGAEIPPKLARPDGISWRQDRVNRGLCEACGNPRGENGTMRKCRQCADKYNAWRNEYRRTHERKDKNVAD